MTRLTLVLVEHDNGDRRQRRDARRGHRRCRKLGEVTVAVAGDNRRRAAEAAAKIAGVAKVLLADDAAYANGLAENVAPLDRRSDGGLRRVARALPPPPARTSPRASPRSST